MTALAHTMGKYAHFEGDKVETAFGPAVILKRTNQDVTILIDDDITATFSEREFFEKFLQK